jgi:Gram-negative porin
LVLENAAAAAQYVGNNRADRLFGGQRQARMWQAVRTGGPAEAASDVSVGGYQDQALAAVNRDLVGPLATGGRYAIRLESGESSALTAFTPRFGSLGMSGAEHLGDEPRGASSEPPPTASNDSQSVLLGLSGTEIAGWAVDLAAGAGVVNPPSSKTGTGESGLVVGGELAVSSLRFDATYGQDAALMGLGLDGSRMTAGVTYGLGPLDTHLSYSVVDRQESPVDTSVFTVGSRLTLTPGLVVQGDVAYADDKRGDAATAGRVSLRLNF